MLFRVFLNLTKHKLLSILLVVFFIFSFISISLTSFYFYKFSMYNEEFMNLDDFIAVSTFDITSDEIVFDLDNKNDYNDLIMEVASDQSIDKYYFNNLNTNLYVKELYSESTENSNVYESYVVGESDLSLFLGYKEESELFENNIISENANGIYVTQNILDKYDKNVGDTVNLYSVDGGVFNLELSNYLGNEVSENFISTIPILGVVEEQELTDDKILDPESLEFQAGVIYIPTSLLLSLPPDAYNISDGSTIIYSDDNDTIYNKYNSKYKDLFVYYTKHEVSKAIKNTKKIEKTFLSLFIVSILFFILLFTVIFRSILQRKKIELRLYSVFGMTYIKTKLQYLLENFLIFTISLILAIPLTFYILRTINSVVSKISRYSIKDSQYISDLYSLASTDLSSTLFSGIDYIKLNKWIIVIQSIIIVIVIIILVVILQLSLVKSSIFDQRRDE